MKTATWISQFADKAGARYSLHAGKRGKGRELGFCWLPQWEDGSLFGPDVILRIEHQARRAGFQRFQRPDGHIAFVN